nr:MAG TPA: hypothetical protein [Bacteriophage sp.]
MCRQLLLFLSLETYVLIHQSQLVPYEYPKLPL